MKRRSAGPVPYSYTRLNTLQTCLRQYYYIYVNRIPELEVWTPNVAKGTFLHRMLGKSWTVDKKTGKLRQKNKSRQAFVNAAKYHFVKNMAGKGSYRGIRVKWDYEGQDWNFFIQEANPILGLFYHISQGEGPPLAVEVPIKAMLNGKDIVVGAADEIRKKHIGFGLKMRDHKYYPRGMSDMQKNLNSQFTIYLSVLTADLASFGPITRNYLHLNREEAKQIAGDSILSPNITLEYHLLSENGRIVTVKRTLEHYIDFTKTLELNKFKLEYAMRTGNFAAERGNHCEYCPVKDRCRKDTLEQKTQIVSPGIESMDIDPYFVKKKKENMLRIPFPRKKKQKSDPIENKV